MTRDQARSRIEKLRKEINYHRYQYHVLDRSLISDAALDSLKHELVELERAYPEFLTPDSPTQRVAGEALDKFTKVRHAHKILSLEDVFSTEELAEYEARIQKLVSSEKLDYFSELKIDGLSIVLTYRNGMLVNGATRGNGEVGEDVTQNLKTIESIPLTLEIHDPNVISKVPELFEVRGEVFLSKKEFEAINKEQIARGEPVYANPRNISAGSIRQLDPSITAARKLSFFAFEILNDVGQQTHEQVHQILRALGFKTEKHARPTRTLAQVGEFIDEWQRKRESLDYQIDGVVVVVNNIALERRLGSIGKTERWMVAYKFPAEQATTVVQEIKIQVGRTGALTPVAHLTPVRVAGTTVHRATLHNEDEIARLDVRIGDTVIIQKAGDIIPDIVQVLTRLRPKNAKKFHMPRTCPVCGTPAVRAPGEAATRCVNPTCIAKDRRRLYYAASKQAFDIEGLGPQIVNKLIEHEIVQNPADFFTLTREDLLEIDGFKDKSADKLIASIAARKKIELGRFFVSLSMRYVGEQTAVDLAQYIGNMVWSKTHTAHAKDHTEISVEEIAATVAALSPEQLSEIDGVGEKVGASIYEFFHTPANRKLIADLDHVGVRAIIRSPQAFAAGPLQGKQVVFTGTLTLFERQAAKEMVKAAGGKTASTVNKKTDYLVVGANAGSKLAKATQLGISVLTEQEFLSLIEKR